ERVQAMTEGHREMGLVVGLTNAEESVLNRIRDVPLLLPGLGAQGGDLSLLSSQNRQSPILINVSRGLLYPSNTLGHAEVAADFQQRIELALNPQ
ncbi:MAG: orotidine-5'-phosphate decarboxylase, partial [Pseudomonadota bacterium]